MSKFKFYKVTKAKDYTKISTSGLLYKFIQDRPVLVSNPKDIKFFDNDYTNVVECDSHGKSLKEDLSSKPDPMSHVKIDPNNLPKGAKSLAQRVLDEDQKEDKEIKVEEKKSNDIIDHVFSSNELIEISSEKPEVEEIQDKPKTKVKSKKRTGRPKTDR